MTVGGAIRLPAGVRDYLPRAAARRRAIIERLLGAFEAWGYARIIAPAFEYADVLERGLGGDARRAAVRFVEPQTGEVVALRPDITPQVARMVATRMRDVGGPIRLCYEGAVTRLEAGPRGQRELLQAGVELIGVPSPEGDAEVLGVAAAALASMRVDDVRLDIGHAAIARAALDGVRDPDRHAALVSALAKKDRRGVEDAARGLPAARRAFVAALPRLYGAPEEVLAAARKLPAPAAVRRALATIERVLDLARDRMDGDLHRRVTVDLGDVRGFDYYTGLRFSGYADGVGDAVLRGGRYDELLAAYGHRAPATGFAVDVEAIADTERAAGLAPPPGPPVVAIAAPVARRTVALRVAAALRARGVRAAVDVGAGGPVAALAAYAARIGAAAAVAVDARGGAAVVRAGASRAACTLSAAQVRAAAAGRIDALVEALGFAREGV